MQDYMWLIVKNMFVCPVLGAMCTTTFVFGRLYKSKFFTILGILGVLATLIIIKTL